MRDDTVMVGLRGARGRDELTAVERLACPFYGHASGAASGPNSPRDSSTRPARDVAWGQGKGRKADRPIRTETNAIKISRCLIAGTVFPAVWLVVGSST